MEFSNYLNYFMWTFDLKNCDVAKNLYVDPSLISKWRTGRRIPKSNMIYQVVEVLVSLCETDEMRLKLCDFLNITYSKQLFFEHADKVVNSLYSFMAPTYKDKDSPVMEQDMFSEQESASISLGAARIFLGEDGFRYCMLGLLDKAVQRGSPFQIYLMTNDSVDWLLSEDDYFQQWGRTIGRCEIAMASAKLIYHQSHNSINGRNYIRAWAPFKRLSNFQTYNLAMRQDDHRIFNHTAMIIPHVGGCFGTNLHNSQNRYMTLFYDQEILQRLENDFNFQLTRCIRTTEQLVMDYTQIASMLYMSSTLAASRDIQLYCGHLPIFTMPEHTLERMLRRGGILDEKIIAHLAAHRKIQGAFHRYLEQSFNFELAVYIPSDLTLNDLSRANLPNSIVNFGRSLEYDHEDAESHINATIEFIRNAPTLHMHIVESILYPTDVLIGYNAFMIEYACNGQNAINCSYQHDYLNDILAYISAAIPKCNHGEYCKEISCQRLKMLRGDLDEK